MAGNKWSRKSMVTPADAFAEYIGQNGYTLKKCDAYLNETHSHFRFIGVVDYIIEDEGGNAIPVIIVPKKDGHPVASKYDSVITELAVVMTLKDYNKGLVIEYDADMRLFGPIYVYPKKHAVTRWNTRINKISKTVSRYFEPMATI